MPAPFPGMDPYLEGYLCPDVHHRLATQISDQLMPSLRPRYVARIEIQVVPDETPEADIGIMYPDVEIVRARQSDSVLPSGSTSTGVPTATSQPITPAALSVPLLDIEVRLATVEIRDTAYNRLVTSIEILSPIDKREPGLSKYRDKRRQLHAADVHILEIDLLRRGQCPLAHPRIPPPERVSHYPDATFDHCVVAARRAVGDDGQRQWVIKTMRGRGYRFVAVLIESTNDTPGAASAPAPQMLPASPVAAARDCPQCQHQNPGAARFCTECGAFLQAIWDEPTDLEAGLRELKGLEFLYEEHDAAEPLYVFKHALTQEVAYDSLIASRRRRLHAAAAGALEQAYATRLEDAYAWRTTCWPWSATGRDLRRRAWSIASRLSRPWSASGRMSAWAWPISC